MGDFIDSEHSQGTCTLDERLHGVVLPRVKWLPAGQQSSVLKVEVFHFTRINSFAKLQETTARF